MAFKESPELFKSIENARSTVRVLRGANGSEHRKLKTNGEFRRETQEPGDPFSALPKGKVHYDDWCAFDVPGPFTALTLADLHIPYHNDAALMTALRYGRDRKPSIVLLNGDASDFFSVSFWEKDPRKRDLKEEIETVREFLKMLRAGFPQARIIYKLGNHEERWERYLSVKAPELLGMKEFKIESVLHFEKHGIELVEDRRPIKLGNLNLIHGHEYRFNISNPVNPARGFYMRAKVCCVGSHLHQTSQHSEKNLDGHVVSTWSTGCLCDLHPDYAPLNNWNHGFAFISADKSNAFHVDNLRIIDGNVY